MKHHKQDRKMAPISSVNRCDHQIDLAFASFAASLAAVSMSQWPVPLAGRQGGEYSFEVGGVVRSFIGWGGPRVQESRPTETIQNNPGTPRCDGIYAGTVFLVHQLHRKLVLT